MADRTIVVLGGGTGGLVVARRLRRSLDAADRVVLVDRSPTYQFAPSFLWVTWSRPLAPAGPLVCSSRRSRSGPLSRSALRGGSSRGGTCDERDTQLRLSRESRYAIVGLSVLAGKPAGTVIGLAPLAEAAVLPAPFLAKIFNKLTHHGILTSFRGRQRGYALARPAADISVREVLEAVDGQDLFHRCIFVSETCDEHNPCPLHDTWAPIMASTIDAMSKTTLADLAIEVAE